MAPAVPIMYSGQKEAKNFSQKKLGKMIRKSRKLSSGHPGGLASDFRHAEEITAESEGFGSSGRVDNELILSEDLCSSKRKCISLNGDSRDRFGVPVQVLSVSKMSRMEKKSTGLRLKRELEEIRVLQRRVVAWSSNIVSPTSDILSCSDGLERPSLENNNTQRLLGPTSVGKKRVPQGKNVPPTKKGFPRQTEPPKKAAPMNPANALLMKQCESLLKQLMKSQHAWVFNAPVDVVKLNIPDYFNVIKHPMDLGTIKSKLARGEYSSPLDFAADVRLTFSNAMTYNPPGNDVHIMAKAVSSYFEQRWKPIEKRIPPNTDMQVLPSRTDTQIHNEVAIDEPPPPKKKKVPPVIDNNLEPVKKGMTSEEKHKLSMELEASLSELPENIIDFLKENSSGAGQTSDDEIEIDIDALSDDILFKLRKLLDDFLLGKKQQSKVEPCEMELHNESGFSTSSIQPDKDSDDVDEDIDIGGNDHPVSSLPLVEVEKDTANKNNRCSSPSSSSSDSGSSSSDSDSGSGNFPCGESVEKKTQHELSKLQGSTLDIEPKLEQNQGDVKQDDGRNQPLESVSLVEDISQQKKPPSVGVEGHKDGESAPSERQVSPDKLYRAALLRSRFADTILKAQEKTLDKGEKRDPEKLRLEREELERRNREEKARLQAEAKAAEEARKKAEAEAAAEAKRKREMEREAARLALQKMEKTVDINENCQFLEDLEMLRAASTDCLSSFMDDESLNDSPNGRLGSFRLGGNSNPLEQLGLYMKDGDDEEEELDAPHSAPNPPSNDVEEGEID